MVLVRKLSTIFVVVVNLIAVGPVYGLSLQEYDQNGDYTGSTQSELEVLWEETLRSMKVAQAKMNRMIQQGDYSKISQFYGVHINKDNRQIIQDRMNKSVRHLEKHGPAVFKSLEWARKHHPNEGFRTMGAAPGETIYAAINMYGLQTYEEYDTYIEDPYIYLGAKFFADASERRSTVIHEVSHMVEGDLDKDSRFVGFHISPFVLTEDLLAQKGEAESVTDAYIWHEFVEDLISSGS